MSESKHTPGPWEAVAVDRQGDWHVFRVGWSEATVPLARIYHGDDRDEPTRVRAGHDARLIAAAPTMRDESAATADELKGLIEWLDSIDAAPAIARKLAKIEARHRALLAQIEGR